MPPENEEDDNTTPHFVKAKVAGRRGPIAKTGKMSGTASLRD
jgi:hypothetical protein